MSAHMPPAGTRREIVSQGWRTVQVAQADGTWWNIRVERITPANP